MKPNDVQVFLARNDEVWVGGGTLRAVSAPESGRPAFLSSRFIEDHGPAWWLPESFAVLPRVGRESHVKVPEIAWQNPSPDSFRRAFGEIAELRERGELTKAVPVVFEEGRSSQSGDDLWPVWLMASLATPPHLFPYGWRRGGEGFVGASPELLLEVESGRLRTMALAGTAPLAEAARLETDPKEGHEHALVVEDILERLRDFGEFRAGPRGLRRLPTLVHLETPIEGALSRELTPELAQELIRALHPTAALGVYPRNPVAEAWLRRHSESVSRGSFGAPFGLWHGDGRLTVIVAIRRVDFRGTELRLGAGCGVVADSVLEREWSELALKRASVKKILGL